MAEKGAPRKFSSSPLCLLPLSWHLCLEGKPNSQSPAGHGTGCLSCVKWAWLQKRPPTGCTCFQGKEDLKASGLGMSHFGAAWCWDSLHVRRDVLEQRVNTDG